MKNITYYNASAGAGKTYTLTNILADKIQSGELKPKQVILTTFTEAAAAEFRERPSKNYTSAIATTKPWSSSRR